MIPYRNIMYVPQAVLNRYQYYIQYANTQSPWLFQNTRFPSKCQKPQRHPFPSENIFSTVFPVVEHPEGVSEM